MNLFPAIAIGGAIAYLTTRRRRRRRAANANANSNAPSNALAPSGGMGDVFAGDSEEPPDIVEIRSGERFTISFVDVSGSTGYSWKLAASPPDNSISLEKKSYEEFDVANLPPGAATGINYYTFVGAKPGRGSLVFHLQAPWLEGKAAPARTLEIETIVS